MSAVLAHSGGWDEALIFGLPIVAVLLWVRWAEKRSRQRREEAAAAADETADSPD